MSALSETVKASFAREYQVHGEALHRWVDPLSDEEFWRNPFGHGNSVGHLVLHLTGNLSYYIGTKIAATGYVRNRDLEFTESSRPAKAEVLRRFDETLALVVKTIEEQSEGDWTKPFEAERDIESKVQFRAFLRCAAHLSHHVGQMIYLAREQRK